MTLCNKLFFSDFLNLYTYKNRHNKFMYKIWLFAYLIFLFDLCFPDCSHLHLVSLITPFFPAYPSWCLPVFSSCSATLPRDVQLVRFSVSFIILLALLVWFLRSEQPICWQCGLQTISWQWNTNFWPCNTILKPQNPDLRPPNVTLWPWMSNLISRAPWDEDQFYQKMLLGWTAVISCSFLSSLSLTPSVPWLKCSFLELTASFPNNS